MLGQDCGLNEELFKLSTSGGLPNKDGIGFGEHVLPLCSVNLWTSLSCLCLVKLCLKILSHEGYLHCNGLGPRLSCEGTS